MRGGNVYAYIPVQSTAIALYPHAKGTEIKIPFASGFPLLPEREKLEKSYELFLV